MATAAEACAFFLSRLQARVSPVPNKQYLQNIPLSALREWDKNYRSITPQALLRLKNKIQALGVFKPLLAVPGAEKGTYQIIGGNQRLRAYRELGFESADIIFFPDLKDKKIIAKIALADNQSDGFTEPEKLLALCQEADLTLDDLDDFALAVSSNRADLFFISKYAPDNDKNFNQIFREMRSVMSALFSYFNDKYGINKLGLVVNYMLCDKEVSPKQKINDIILSNKPANKKFTVYSLEGQDVLVWKGKSVFDVNKIWDAKYSVTNKAPVDNLGILRDISVGFLNNKLSDEEYNEFLQFAAPLFSFETIKERVS